MKKKSLNKSKVTAIKNNTTKKTNKLTGKESTLQGKNTHQSNKSRTKNKSQFSEEHYKLLSEISSDFAFSVLINDDKTQTLEWISSGFKKEMGFPFQGLLKPKNWKKYFPQEDTSTIEKINRSIINNRKISAEYRIIKSNGTVSYLQGIFKPVFDRTKKRVVKFYGVIRNVTEKKKIEFDLLRFNNELEERIAEKTSQLKNAVSNLKHEVSIRTAAENQVRNSEIIISEIAKNLDKKLRESEYKHLWNVFEHSEIASVTIAQNGLCVNYNKAAERLFGYTHEELPNVEAWLTKLIPNSKYRAIVRRVTYNAMENQLTTLNNEIDVVTKSGELKHLILQINSILHEGVPIGIQLGQFIDNTEKKKAAQDLKATLEKYKVLFNVFPLGITVADYDGKIVETNIASEALLGISTDEHKSRKINSPEWKIVRSNGTVMPPEEFAGARAFAEGKIIRNVEMGIVGEDNNVTWLSVTAAPLPVNAGGGVVIAYGDITQKVATGKALQESEERYRQLIDSSPFAFFVHKNGAVLFANDASIRMFHAQDSSQVVGKNLYDYVHPDYLNIASTKLGTSSEHISSSLLIELKYYCLDGKLIDVEAMAIPITYNGESAVLVVANDVTEKNIAQSKLYESEIRLRFLVETSPIILFSIDKNGIFTLSEGNGLSKLGLRPGEVVGLSALEFYKDYQTITTAINKALKGISTRELLTVGNVVFDISYTPLFDKNGNVDSISGMAYDITAQSQIEDALLKSMRQWQATFDSVSDAVWLVDLNSVIVRANKTTEKIIGKPLSQVIGRHCFEVVHENEGPINECPFQKMKITLQRESMVYQKGKNWYQVTADPIFNDKRELTGTVHSITDITERHNYQEKLKQSEALYRLLSDNSADVIWLLDINSRTFSFVSPSVFKLRGFTTEEVMKQKLEDALTPESYKIFIENLQKAIESVLHGSKDLVFLTSEVDQIHKNGKIIPTEIVTSIITNETGIPVQVLGVTRDVSERREAQRKLLDSEERYRKIVEMSPEAIFVHYKGEFLFANNATLELVGLKSFEELKKKKLMDYLHPDSIELVLERLDALNRRIVDQMPYAEYKIIKADGTLAYIESTAVTIDFHGIHAIQSVARNVTQRREDEKALKESQERFRHVVEYSPSAIIIHQNGKVVYSNPAAVKLIGAESMDEVLNKSVLDFVHPEYKNFAMDRIKQAAKTMKPLPPAEEKIIRLDGKILDVEIVAVPFYLNNLLAHQLIIRDITEEKAKTEELRKLFRAVEQNTAAVIITDINGIIEYVNPRCLEITGYSSEEIIGQTPRMFQSGKQNIDFYESLWSTILEGNEWRGDFQNKKKNGDIYWEFTSISPIKDSVGKITHFVAIKEDITDRKRFDDEMSFVKDEAEHAYKVKTSLLANMSHELRTPLNGIIGFSQLLKDYVEDTDAQVMVDKIIKSGQRLSNTFTEILSLSELEMGDVEIKNELVDLSVFCHEMKLLFADRAAAKNLSFEVEVLTDSLTTFSDEDWLSRIATHLLDNAIKFTSSGGITIQLAHPVVKDDIQYAVVNIIDTGIGIKKEEQKSLFKEFRQISEGTRRDFEGLGLGLSLSKRIAHNINCLITSESEFEKGSTFSILIPLLSELPHEKIFPEPVIINRLSKQVQKSEDKNLRILLVEDNPLNIEVVERFLSKTGEVTPVRDGESAVIAAQKDLFDLLLVDISLGHGIDGIEVLKRIRLMENYVNVPAIALTGYVSETNKRRFQAAGFNGFLGKPFEKKDLLNYISKMFKESE